MRRWPRWAALGRSAGTARPGGRRPRRHRAVGATALGAAGRGGAAVALGVYGAGFSLCFAAAVPWLDEAFDEAERGLAYGVQNLLYAGGYALGPVLGGLLLEVAGANLAYLLTAAVLAAGAAGMLAASRRAEPAEGM
jgi:MFS family permease